MNVRHVKLPWILRLSVTELGKVCSEEEHSRIQCTVGKTGYSKSNNNRKNNNTQNENKIPLGLLTQRSSSLTIDHVQRCHVSPEASSFSISTLSTCYCSSLLWNVQEVKASHPPIHRNPRREPSSPLCSPCQRLLCS